MRRSIWLAVLVLACEPGRGSTPPPVGDGRPPPPASPPATPAAGPAVAPATGDSLELFVFDWSASDRSELDRLRHDGSAIFLRLAGGVAELHPECGGGGLGVEYTYTGESPRSEHVDQDGKTLDVTIVGTWTIARLPTDACDGATHVVRAAAVGAFAATSRTSGQARGEVSVGGATVGGSSSRTTSSEHTSGKLAGCAAARAGDRHPPPQCGSAIRLSLVPIRR